ncbi:MAG: peptidoglycan-binding protein [Verrucomicrobia bacterium]|nr:peptidoglycan-binding protein [Verrucomicrobiota bacterium]
MKACHILFWFYATALILLLPIATSFAHGGSGGGGHPGMGGFGGGGHQGFSAAHHTMGIRPMGLNRGDPFHDGGHRFFDHGHFAHDRFFHHHNRFFFGFDFVAFGFPDWWYPYDWYPYDYYDYSDYSPVYDYRYWYGLATAVQTELTARGYYHGQINGVIGSDSRQAIRAFQQARGLPVTGLIDPSLLKALNLPKVPRVA